MSNVSVVATVLRGRHIFVSAPGFTCLTAVFRWLVRVTLKLKENFTQVPSYDFTFLRIVPEQNDLFVDICDFASFQDPV
jgi:hypothetical protein